MSYDGLVPITLGPAGGALSTIDLNDAADTAALAWKAPCNMIVYGAYAAAVIEAIGSMTTTVGVGSMSHTPAGGSIAEKCTFTPTVSEAEGASYMGTDFTPFFVAAGELITLKTKTQAVDGTVTGELEVTLLVQMKPSLDGVA